MTKTMVHETGVPAAGAPASPADANPHRATWKLILVVLVCIAPVIVSYLVYYVVPPSGRTNYGELVLPQLALPSLGPGDALGRHKGQWILVQYQDGPCDEACAKRLFFMRQSHAALGRDRDRVDMVLLKPDAIDIGPVLHKAHPQLDVIRIDPAAAVRWLPVGAGGRPGDHLYVVDPQHNLMMRFPADPDPAKVRKDLQRLLKASRIG
ncbi:MAG: cytochrome C oxidase subunit I [Lautropia sp.]